MDDTQSTPGFPCPECDYTAPTEMGLRIHTGRSHKNTTLTATTGEAPVSRERAPSSAAVEVAPKRPKSWRDRFKSKKKTDGAPSTRERAPKRSGALRGKRVPLDTDISDAWGFLARRLENTPHYPTGRMLQYQAPAAGVILDKALAGTLPDRMVFQPLVRSRDKWEEVGFLLAGPLVTYSITRTLQMMQVALQEGDQEQAIALQRRYEMQLEGFDWLLNAMLPRLVEGKRIAQEKKAKSDAILAEAFPELAGTGTSPAEALRDMLFAPPSFVTHQGGPDDNPVGPTANGHRPDSVAEPGNARSGT